MEHYVMNNDTALVRALYPSLLRAFKHYVAFYNTTAWLLPYKAHETYDAVPQSPTQRGGGNRGYSLYNAVNYLGGLRCMEAFAEAVMDIGTAAQARQMNAAVRASIQQHFWQPSKGFYLGDTIGTEPVLEADGTAWKSSDDLHGQTLAYRLGLGDLLPRDQMESHQAFVLRDLGTPWGLTWDRFAQQNWIMSDHTHATLALRWHQADGWNTSLKQVRYWRNVRKEATRHTAVFNTITGQYGLLNYYGYALFFFHTISAFSGQVAHLPRRSLDFQPHPSAFDPAGSAVLPLLLGGDLGSVTLTPASATVEMAFLKQPLSFLNVTICQHAFVATDAAPYNLVEGKPLVLQLPSPCTHDKGRR